MNAGTNTHITIDGVDITSYVINYKYSVGIDNQIDNADLLLSKDVLSAITILNNSEVIIKRGKTTGEEYHVFRGNVSTKSPKGVSYEVTANDKLGTLQNKEVTNVYENTDIDDIATSLVETYGGMTIDTEDSGAGSNFNRFMCNYDKIYERLQTLRKIMNWTLWYDSENDKVIFKNKGTNIHSLILYHNTTGTTNVGGIIKWDWDADNLVNSATIVGGPVLDRKEEKFTGDGSTKQFTLNSIPESIDVEHPSGTRKVLGVTNGTATFHYTIDKPNKQINFETAPVAGANNVIANYTAYVPVTVQRKDEASISSYGLVEDTFYYPDILTVQDAEIKAKEILDRFSQPLPRTFSLPVPQTTIPLRPGDSIRVIDDINNIDQYLTVTRITYRWPEVHDLVDLGQEAVQDRLSVKDISERVSKLEKIQAQNINYVNIVVDLPDDLRCRGELEIQVRDVSYDGAWGIGFGDGTTKKDYEWGEAGGLWQAAYTNEPTTEVLTHQSNQYEEEFVDERFVVSAETSASVDTTNNEVIF